MFTGQCGQDLEHPLGYLLLEVRNVGQGLDDRLLRCFQIGSVKLVAGLWVAMKEFFVQAVNDGLIIIVRRH